MKANRQIPTPRGGLSIASAAYGIPRGSNLMPRRLKMAETCPYNSGIRGFRSKFCCQRKAEGRINAPSR
jgi:hypothetical protein